MIHFTRLLALLLLPSFALKAQDASSFSQNAEELFAAGKIAEAAEQYELAGRVNDNSEMLYKAAEAYYRIRDYAKAAECYGLVKNEYERYELAGLRYARALKQNSRYEMAIGAFREFATRYKGTRKAQIVSVVANEIKGCELAIRMAQEVSPIFPAELKILPKSINTTENEYSPMSFSDNLLYFSAIVQGQVMLMRSQKQLGSWQQPTVAQGLPEAVSSRFGNGAFSPDGERFYCTQCAEPTTAKRGGNGLRTSCSLFVLRRTAEGGWSEPLRLRDYINSPDHTVTHPFVAQVKGRELLFFASDREGGFGGLDLYVCERPLDSDDLDFSFPQNLGNTVNTAGDDVTPFFDPTSQTLWFSSNSHPSLGGLDVFKSVRSKNKWSKPENVGYPVNSSADDFFFTLKKNNNGGFLASNRLFGAAKTSTHDEDIFEFLPVQPPVILAGKVLEQSTEQPISNCAIALYEIGDNSEQRLLEVRPSEDGAFQFSILPDKQYRVEVAKEGFITASVRPLNVDNEVIVSLKAAPEATKPEPVFAVQRESDASFSDNSAQAPTTQSSFTYKIHLEVQPDFDARLPRYEMARNFGAVSAEPLPAQGLIRVLLGDFNDQDSANEIAAALRKSGSFPQAFVVREGK